MLRFTCPQLPRLYVPYTVSHWDLLTSCHFHFSRIVNIEGIRNVFQNKTTLVPLRDRQISQDQLIFLFQDVEKFAERRRQRGVNVSAVRFDDSPHVKHFSVHREIYINTVCSFLHSCLSGMLHFLHNNNQAIQFSLSYFLSTLKCFYKLWQTSAIYLLK